ncbi:MAG: hypothetical protein OEV66_09450 [Spirochaetia bacterium]|nr:hypothetical protein [Spirochaetia bacterium]
MCWFIKKLFCSLIVWQSLNIYAIEIPSWEDLRQNEKSHTYTPEEDKKHHPGDIKEFDLRKLRNHWPYLVEGKGGMGVLLGEKEAMVYRILGQPTRRSFETLDELYFIRRTITGSILLYKSVVSRIRYEVSENQEESLKWKTAAGLRQEMIESMSEDEAKKFILNFYKSPPFLEKKGSLVIYFKGISFYWNGGKLRTIEIFEPWETPS